MGFFFYKSSVLGSYIDIIKDVNKGDVPSVRTTYGETGEFPMTISLHQGSALSRL